MCELCDVPIYVKTQKVMKSALAPLTYTEELRQELEDITGEMYLEFPKRYCPHCGKFLGESKQCK